MCSASHVPDTSRGRPSKRAPKGGRSVFFAVNRVCQISRVGLCVARKSVARTIIQTPIRVTFVSVTWPFTFTAVIERRKRRARGIISGK